jgi:small subunit ribosomal protein S2
VREARRLGLPVIALVDTNADPDEADYVIPGNDDAIRSCGLIARVIADAIDAGKQKVTTRDFERPSNDNGNGAAPAPTPEGVLEVAEPAAAVEPDAEGESVPVPTGVDPQNEGAAETKDAVASTEENGNG